MHSAASILHVYIFLRLISSQIRYLQIHYIIYIVYHRSFLIKKSAIGVSSTGRSHGWLIIIFPVSRLSFWGILQHLGYPPWMKRVVYKFIFSKHFQPTVSSRSIALKRAVFVSLHLRTGAHRRGKWVIPGARSSWIIRNLMEQPQENLICGRMSSWHTWTKPLWGWLVKYVWDEMRVKK